MKKTLLLISMSLLTGCSMFGGTIDTDPQPTRVPETPTVVPTQVQADKSTFMGGTKDLLIDKPVQAWNWMVGKTPSADAVDMETASADGRRSGINQLVDRDFGKTAPYTTRYGQIAQFDQDPIVRATAIRALNRSRDASAIKVYIAGLADDDVHVRLEAAKALSNVPSADAVPGLIKLASTTSEDTDVRIAATEALRHYRSTETARTLISLLDNRDFSLAWQARQSLRAMTGGDYRYDQTAWTNFISSDQKPLG